MHQTQKLPKVYQMQNLSKINQTNEEPCISLTKLKVPLIHQIKQSQENF